MINFLTRIFMGVGGYAACVVGSVNLYAGDLILRQDPTTQAIVVSRESGGEAILTQNAGADFRPFIHPIVAPDGKGVITEFSPGHHKHQTGLYWGFTKLNGRDYFHNPSNGYWRRLSSQPIVAQGPEVKWSTEYHLLDAAGQPVLKETQLWTMRDDGARYLLDLEWTGEAMSEVKIGGHPYGGLFLRMPWKPGMESEVVNNARQRNQRANGQRAVWTDLGLKIEGRTDLVHVAILDHPQNEGYPLPWRVDDQFGVGASRAILGDWGIEKGKKAVFRHQFVVYTGSFSDVAIDAAWKAFSGEQMDSALWNLARQEGKKATFLTGEQAVAKMTVPPGFEVKLTAAEPLITQPMAFCWDDRGRLWVAENRDYETRRSGFSGSGDSRIVILEDTDGDGKMDTRNVFLEGIPFPAAIAWGFDGLWLGAPPNLLFVPDRNHDDKADQDIEVRLTGWGIQDRHETLNSLNWGPDGWLYGCQGFATQSKVGKPADGGRIFRPGEPFPQDLAVKDPQYIDGGVWRYHPTKDRFEIVAHGFSNPWGLDFDDHGQMFITACVIPHLWYVIPGGIYHRQGGKHINPYVYDDIKTIADHRHRSAHGGARVYLAEEFPAEYRNRIFMANIHERSLLTDILRPVGSGFVGTHGDDALLANDPQWVGFSVEIGPDGAVYILDWHDAEICGQDVHDKDTGRIFRFAPAGLAGKAGLNLAALSDVELVKLQLHRNDWYVRRSRVLLQQRAAAGQLEDTVHDQLWEMFEQQSETGRKLRALWALHVTGGLDRQKLLPMLDHPAVYVRAWAIQLLTEDGSPGGGALAKFADRAAHDPSPVVRLYLASCLQRLPVSERWNIAAALAAHGEDAGDHNLPKMIWYAVEPMVEGDAGRALALASGGKLPIITNYTARRATAHGQIDLVIKAAAGTTSDPVQQALLEGLRDGLASLDRRSGSAPTGWSSLEAELLKSESAALRNVTLQLGQLFGSEEAARAQLLVLREKSATSERRKAILQGFARDAYAPALDDILAVLQEPELRRDALRALAAFDDPRVAETLLGGYARWSGSDRQEAILTLTARKHGAAQLLAALKAGTIPRADLSAYAARQMQRVIGPSFVDFWGPLTSAPRDKQADVTKYKQLLTDDVLAKANLSKGRAVFERTCYACHTMYGTGGLIGPDLTGSNRANLDYILNEIIHPSDVIQDDYRLVTINTQDGRTLAGNIAAEDERQVTLRLIGQDTIVPKSTILTREVSEVSMMPEGLLKTLTNEEVRDLIAYLRTTEQVPALKPVSGD